VHKGNPNAARDSAYYSTTSSGRSLSTFNPFWQLDMQTRSARVRPPEVIHRNPFFWSSYSSRNRVGAQGDATTSCCRCELHGRPFDGSLACLIRREKDKINNPISRLFRKLGVNNKSDRFEFFRVEDTRQVHKVPP
jgi:hypothetical protein